MLNTLQVFLALVGLLGTTVFLAQRAFASQQRSTSAPSRLVLAALFSGLSAWTALSLIRRDIVASVGLILAMILLFRHYKARRSSPKTENSNTKKSNKTP
ncbi:hypothetical protein [Desulfonatronum thiosulfatophilum]|uniref:hypothetical protein n=1 Tax=Desulfonatronum thiosulfatophilum TaxID=617002 RepID=UPI0011145BA3|nr:hypothetical protein [Desulfonatronum thiosulfatophilum]